MPRIAFSFPISDEALFFAHYDVLTKRPTTGNRLNPIHYFYLQTGNINTVNNPSLLPETTIDYEMKKVPNRDLQLNESILKEIELIDINNTTPLQALEILIRLKKSNGS